MVVATKIIIAVVALGLIAWDVYAASSRVRGATISEILRYAGSRFLTLPFAFGVVGGHVFGPAVPYRLGFWLSMGIVATLAAFVSVFHILEERDPPHWAPLVSLLWGITVGMLAWPL